MTLGLRLVVELIKLRNKVEIGMKIIIYNGENEVIAFAEGEHEVTLFYEEEYKEGDRIVIASEKAKFLNVKVDEFVDEAIVYIPEGKVEFKIPFDMMRWAYHFCAFEEDKHIVTAKEEKTDIFGERVNLAKNAIDQRYTEGCYPHASANYISQEQGWFEAKSAIDGNTSTHGHGPYPFQSWGTDKREDTEFKVDFGREVIIDEIVLFLRSDDFQDHDINWSTGVLEFSDGTKQEINMIKSPEGQSYPFAPKKITWIKLHSLKRAKDDAYAALTQIEVYGYEEHIKDEGMICEKFQELCQLDKEFLTDSIQNVIDIMDNNLEKFNEKFPDSATTKGVYPFCQNGNARGVSHEPGSNVGWTTSFWTGMLSLAEEQCEDEKIKKIIDTHIDSFYNRIKEDVDCNTHDVGFLYSLSCVSAFKKTGNEKAKQAALLAADKLMTRYVEKAGIIQAWGDVNDPTEEGRMIIDCLMNLPLLYWASVVTGNDSYKKAAYSHAKKAAKYAVREDATTYHTYFFDVNSGAAKFGRTAQGYSDDSCWARGQAWAIYGFILSYAYTKDEQFLTIAKKTANYFLNRSGEDGVVYWDLIFNKEDDEEKDSSASAIAVCGLLEMQKYLTDEKEKRYYDNAANHILKSLAKNYTAESKDSQNEGVLLHGVYIKKHIEYGVDESNLWGDYFYFEALTRATSDWNMYW